MPKLNEMAVKVMKVVSSKILIFHFAILGNIDEQKMINDTIFTFKRLKYRPYKLKDLLNLLFCLLFLYFL